MFKLLHRGCQAYQSSTIDGTILEYVQEKQDALSSHTRIFVALRTLSGSPTTYVKIAEVYQTIRPKDEHGSSYIPVTGEMIRKKVKRIICDLETTLLDPRQKIHPYKGCMIVCFGFIGLNVRDLASYEIHPLRVFPMMNKRMPAASVINGELCRGNLPVGAFGALACFFINKDANTKHVRNIGYGSDQIFDDCAMKEFVGYSGGAIIRCDNRYESKSAWLSLLQDELHPDTIVLYSVYLCADEYNVTPRARTISQHVNRKEQKRQLMKTIGRRREKYYENTLNSINKLQATQATQMLSLLALIKFVGDVVLPCVAPACRPIALVLD